LENQLETAKLQYELLKTTSSNELETLSAQLQLARKEYETLYTTYNKLSVRAPLAGTIAQLFVTPGESISKGSPLFTLIPHTALPTLTVALSFNEYLTALPLNEVEIVLPDSFPSPHIFTGSISTRSPIANENEMYTLTIQSSVPLPEGLTECEVRFATF
jgi:multidrug efflux pump subunit AcrA (membrane-fusion protein)